MRVIAKTITNIIFSIFYRIEYVNLHKIPSEGPLLLCSNHQTVMDMFFLGYKMKRWVYWMAKEELFRNPILGFIFKKLGAFPIKRGKGDVGSIKTAYKLLREGNIVGIFPYGTRSNSKNKNNIRVKSGAAMIALNTGAQIIPATIHGSYRPFSKMRIIYGEPFTFNASYDRKYSSEELKEFSKEIMKRINSLVEE